MKKTLKQIQIEEGLREHEEQEICLGYWLAIQGYDCPNCQNRFNRGCGGYQGVKTSLPRQDDILEQLRKDAPIMGDYDGRY